MEVGRQSSFIPNAFSKQPSFAPKHVSSTSWRRKRNRVEVESQLTFKPPQSCSPLFSRGEDEGGRGEDIPSPLPSPVLHQNRTPRVLLGPSLEADRSCTPALSEGPQAPPGSPGVQTPTGVPSGHRLFLPTRAAFFLLRIISYRRSRPGCRPSPSTALQPCTWVSVAAASSRTASLFSTSAALSAPG